MYSHTPRCRSRAWDEVQGLREKWSAQRAINWLNWKRFHARNIAFPFSQFSVSHIYKNVNAIASEGNSERVNSQRTWTHSLNSGSLSPVDAVDFPTKKLITPSINSNRSLNLPVSTRAIVGMVECTRQWTWMWLWDRACRLFERVWRFWLPSKPTSSSVLTKTQNLVLFNLNNGVRWNV